MTVFFIPLLLILLYLVGGVIDRRVQHNYFIGGLLPFIGWQTDYYGPMKMEAFWTAWFWNGIMWTSKVTRRDE